ncbi:hypothetical protein ACHFCA_16700 [Delftia tsuruhatensis]
MTAPTPHLRALAEAAEGNGEHIYTHPRDSNKWRENEAWHRAASPGAVLHLLDRIAELEACKPLPLSDEQIDDLHGEANRGFDIGREEYFKAFRDAEHAHGIKEP